MKRAMKMDFNPTWSAGNILAMILGTPAFDKTQTNWTHLCQLVYSLITIIDWLWKQLCEFLVVENFQRAAWWNLAHCCWVKPVTVVAISTLHKDGWVAKAFSINLSTNVVKVHTFSNVSSCALNGWVTIDIRQQTQAESFRVFSIGIGESINKNAGGVGLELLSNSVV